MTFEASGTSTIEPELLLQELRSGRDLILVDVRSATEFGAGHIHRSRLLPLHELPARCSEIAMHRAEPIVLVSGEGLRARLAAGALRLAGFEEITVLAGGLRRWRELGYAVEPSGTPAPSCG